MFNCCQHIVSSTNVRVNMSVVPFFICVDYGELSVNDVNGLVAKHWNQCEGSCEAHKRMNPPSVLGKHARWVHSFMGKSRARLPRYRREIDLTHRLRFIIIPQVGGVERAEEGEFGEMGHPIGDRMIHFVKRNEF